MRCGTISDFHAGLSGRVGEAAPARGGELSPRSESAARCGPAALPPDRASICPTSMQGGGAATASPSLRGSQGPGPVARDPGADRETRGLFMRGAVPRRGRGADAASGPGLGPGSGPRAEREQASAPGRRRRRARAAVGAADSGERSRCKRARGGGSGCCVRAGSVAVMVGHRRAARSCHPAHGEIPAPGSISCKNLLCLCRRGQTLVANAKTKCPFGCCRKGSLSGPLGQFDRSLPRRLLVSPRLAGSAHLDFLEAMRAEHCLRGGHDEEFVTLNYHIQRHRCIPTSDRVTRWKKCMACVRERGDAFRAAKARRKRQRVSYRWLRVCLCLERGYRTRVWGGSLLASAARVPRF